MTGNVVLSALLRMFENGYCFGRQKERDAGNEDGIEHFVIYCGASFRR